MVYSTIIQYEGLETFKIYLRYFGFSDMMVENDSKIKMDHLWGYAPKYTMYYGEMDLKERTRSLTAFNHVNNVNGSVVRVILMSKIAQEGISLRAVR